MNRPFSCATGPLAASILLAMPLAGADLAIAGTPLAITGSDVLAVKVTKSGVRQYFDTYNTFLRIGATVHHSCTASASGFPSPSVHPFTPISHAKPDDFSIQTVASAGGIEIQHTLSYVQGEERFSHAWRLTNTTGSAIADLALLYGGDTYFENMDTAAGYWDPALQMVYCKRAGANGLMGIQGGSGSAPGAYLTDGFSTVWTALASGSLGSTVNATNIDNGMALQWNQAALAAGATWTVTAIERWTPENTWAGSPLTVQVIAGGLPGQPVSMDDGSHGQGNVIGGGLTDPGAGGVSTGVADGSRPGAYFTVVFSGPVTGLETADFLVGGTAGGTVTSISPPSGPADRYVVTISGMTSSGTISLEVLPNAVTDADGNSNSASAGGDPDLVWSAGTTGGASDGGGGCGLGGLGVFLLGCLIAMLRLRESGGIPIHRG